MLRPFKDPMRPVTKEARVFLWCFILPHCLCLTAVDPFWESYPISLAIAIFIVLLASSLQGFSLDSIKDSRATVAEARFCTPCLSFSILAQPRRPSREQNKASCSPMPGISKSSSWNSLTYSRICLS